MAKSLYKTLEVSEDTALPEIKKAYKKLAKKYHPDLNKDKEAEEKFKEINAAYEVLSDSQKKAQYDRLGDSMFGGQSFHDFSQSRTNGGVDLNDILNQVFGGMGQRGGGGSFESMFNQGHGSSGFHSRSNAQQEIDLDLQVSDTIAFDVAVLGGKRTVQSSNDSFDVKIPAGIKDGAKLRIKGKGKRHGNRAGDMYITINIAPSPEYTRDDYDLEKQVDIPLKLALFGGKVDIKTLYKTIALKIPKDTKQNQSFRLKEYGVIDPQTKIKGYLYIKVNIVNPKIDDLNKDFIEALKENL